VKIIGSTEKIKLKISINRKIEELLNKKRKTAKYENNIKIDTKIIDIMYFSDQNFFRVMSIIILRTIPAIPLRSAEIMNNISKLYGFTVKLII
jgi:hypothetical protein